MTFIVLFRRRLLPWTEWFLSHANRGDLYEKSVLTTHAADFRKVLDISATWQAHWNPVWCICGARLSQQPICSLNADDILSLEKAYSWSLRSWGADHAGLMVALNSSDDHMINEATGRLAADGCADLLLSQYSVEDISAGKVRGAVFSRRQEERSEGIWPHMSVAENSVFALALDWQLPRDLKESNEIVAMEKSSAEHGKGICIKITSQEEFAKFAHPRTKLLVAGYIPIDVIRATIDRFQLFLEDPLAYAKNNFRDANLIYVPDTARGHQEILICRDAGDAAKVIRDVSKSISYRMTCFC